MESRIRRSLTAERRCASLTPWTDRQILHLGGNAPHARFHPVERDNVVRWHDNVVGAYGFTMRKRPAVMECTQPLGHADWMVHVLGYLKGTQNAGVRSELFRALVSAEKEFAIPSWALDYMLEFESVGAWGDEGRAPQPF
jgi:hypothetical protein